MGLSSILLAGIMFLGATAVCVMLFQRLGFGAVLGFIVAGVLIGPHTPGPVPIQQVDQLQSIAELGVVLFLFAVGLEMRPRKIWSMRRLLFGLGSAQMLLTALVLAAYFVFIDHAAWQAAVILGLGFAMSSTAIVMTTLEERGELTSDHGQTSFAVLMAQDLWIVPVMALVPILAHKTAQTTTMPLWEKGLMVVGALAGIVVVGRYLLPALLGYCARQRRMDAFGIVLFLAVIASAWAVDRVGISMTLGAFLMGMLLSASDYRYQIEATVAPFRGTLMGLFFIAVGMSIDIGALVMDWSELLVHVPVVLFVNTAVLIALALAFGVARPTAIRTGLYLSQAGEFAFVLIGAATVSGLLSADSHTLAMLVVSISMILTPLMMKAGDLLDSSICSVPSAADATAPATALNNHVVVIGYEEVGQLICLMLDKASIPYTAFDRDFSTSRQGKQSGHDVHFGDMCNAITQKAANLDKAAAAFVTSRDTVHAKGLAVTLHRLYPQLDVHVIVHTLMEQDELATRGIEQASTTYIEGTLVRGGQLLKNLGIAEADVIELVSTFRKDNYALIRANYAETAQEE
jgi:glutathione-regulated potassium-efflux system protein KefB